MANYYFVASSLPSLRLEEPPEMKFDAFLNLLRENLCAHDYAKVDVILRFIDLQNLCSYWRNQSLDPRGTKNLLELEESIQTMSDFPEYVRDFLNRYDSKSSLLKNFSQLIVAYFRETIGNSTGFLRQYLNFEREWRLIMLAFRSKQLKRDVAAELQYEDPHDTIVAQILAQSDAQSYEPPDEYKELRAIFEENYEDPIAIQKALYAYRFAKMDALTEGVPLFSVDYILAYTIQLIIVENIQELEAKNGN